MCPKIDDGYESLCELFSSYSSKIEMKKEEEEEIIYNTLVPVPNGTEFNTVSDFETSHFVSKCPLFGNKKENKKKVTFNI